MLYQYDHPSGSKVFLSRDVIETMQDIIIDGEGTFTIDSEVSADGDLIAVIKENENLTSEETETLDHHYSKVLEMMERFSGSKIVSEDEKVIA